MKRICTIAVTLAAAGCSTGIVPTDQGKYMISTTSAAGALGNPNTLKAEQYQQANDFCGKQGKAVETTGGALRNGVPFVRASGSSLEFRCVTPTPAVAASATQ